MKRISFLLAALLLMCGMAVAQNHRRGGNRNIDPKARAERMTERMAKEYSLNETQKKQLLEATVAMVGKNAERNERAKPKMKQGRKDKCTQVTNCCCSTKAKKLAHKDRQKMRSEMQASREAYDAQLKQIMTKEQYDSYTRKLAERKQRMKEGQRSKGA